MPDTCVSKGEYIANMNGQEGSEIIFDRAISVMDHGDATQALGMLLPLARQNHAQAQAVVGSIYLTHSHRMQQGQFADDAKTYEEEWERFEEWEREDLPEAVEWLTKASEQGIGPASHNLAMLYLDKPKFLPQKEAIERAKFFYLKAHAQGFGVVGMSEANWKYYEEECE